MSSPSIPSDVRDRLRDAKRHLRLAIRRYGFKRLRSEPALRREIVNTCIRENQLVRTSLKRHFRLFAASALLGGEKFFL